MKKSAAKCLTTKPGLRESKKKWIIQNWELTSTGETEQKQNRTTETGELDKDKDRKWKQNMTGGQILQNKTANNWTKNSKTTTEIHQMNAYVAVWWMLFAKNHRINFIGHHAKWLWILSLEVV